jgi:hypothetical protein
LALIYPPNPLLVRNNAIPVSWMMLANVSLDVFIEVRKKPISWFGINLKFVETKTALEISAWFPIWLS